MKPPSTGARRAAIDDIETALKLALQGIGPRTLMITAGPGSGKTHILRQLTEAVGISTRWSTADELSWRLPYAVVSALTGTPVPAPVSAGFDEEIYAAVDALGAREPQILVVDDAHNADAGSLEVLGRLAVAAADLPLVLVLARRHLPVRELLTRLLSRPSVREWTLPAMDAADLEVLTHQLFDAWPDERLAAVLSQSGGNPMHALAVLENLRAQGNILVDGQSVCSVGHADAVLSSSLDSAVREQLSLLGESAKALVHKLAVWGGPATLVDLAALDDASPASLVGPVQTVIDAGVVAASDSGVLTFTHDVYADVAYEDLAPVLRTILHTAIARHHEAVGDAQLAAHHFLAAGVDDHSGAVVLAQKQLSHVPAVAADLLETVAAQSPSATRTLELDLATALARSGQLSRSADVAARGLTKATDITTIAQLHRTLLFTSIAQGKTPQVLALIDSTLGLPVDASTRAALVDVRRYVGLLEGASPIPSSPFVITEESSVGELVTEGLRKFLGGDPEGGLNLALEASRREGLHDTGLTLSTSADIWPPLIEQFRHGPTAAVALLQRATQLRTDRGATWMTAYHEFDRGGVELALGRLDDAAASLDSGLERAEAAGMGWTSISTGARARIDVYRGEFASASQRLEEFKVSGLPNQFGWPICGTAQVVLLELQRKLKPAAAEADRWWTHANDLGLYGWLPSFALDCARVATRSGDDALAEKIVLSLADVPTPVPEAGAGSVELARALCTGSLEVEQVAVACARAAQSIGDVITEAAAWEEAACAAAVTGDRSAAKEHARRALLLTQNMGATALSSRIATRLRALGLRLDPSTMRERPHTGWDSLTRTEVTIAEMVATGLNGTEIAERLFISQRTVQTHVSHVLTKMGLRTRVELAALVAGRGRESPESDSVFGRNTYVP